MDEKFVTILLFEIQSSVVVLFFKSLKLSLLDPRYLENS